MNNPPTGVLKTLRYSAALTAFLALVQGILGGITIGSDGLSAVHGMVGNVTFVVALVAAVAAVLFIRQPGNGDQRGLMMHALGIAVLCLIQVALGEMGVRLLHIGLGVVVLIGAFALADLSFRRPEPAEVEA